MTYNNLGPSQNQFFFQSGGGQESHPPESQLTELSIDSQGGGILDHKRHKWDKTVLVYRVFYMNLKYPVRVKHLIGKQISVRFDPDQAFGEGFITAAAVCILKFASASLRVMYF